MFIIKNFSIYTYNLPKILYSWDPKHNLASFKEYTNELYGNTLF